MALRNETGGIYINSRIAVSLIALIFVTNLSWLGWLSMQAMQMDRVSMINTRNIDSVISMQARTVEMLDKINDRQHELELQFARHKTEVGYGR